MGDPKFDMSDFDFSMHVHEDENSAVLIHFEVADDLQNNGYGSVIIETLKRVAFQNLEVDVLEVSMGGGEKAEHFLESNGFEVFNTRMYSNKAEDHLGSKYGVDARYRKEWVSDDYSRY